MIPELVFTISGIPTIKGPRGGAEDGLSEFYFDEVHVSSEFGVSEVGVGIAMRRLQARQASRQMCRQMGQIGQVDHNHGCRCRFTVAAEPLCANVGESAP